MQTDKTQQVIRAMLAMQRYAWEQGTASQALWEAGEKDWMILMAREAVHRQDEVGRTAKLNETGLTDPCSNGEPIYHAWELTGDDTFRQAFDRLLEWALVKAPRSADGIVYHIDQTTQFWVDSFYMLPPFLAFAGHYDEAVKQIDGFWKALHDEEAGLLSHMWDDVEKVFKRKAFWGVGNGWTMAGLARVIDLLPESHAADKKRLIERNRSLIDACLSHQRDDKLFHDVLDDPDSFIEVNIAQMLAYAIYRGLASGWLPADYRKTADDIRAAVWEKVDEYGCVTDVCGPPHFVSPSWAVEGQSFFILMEAARNKLDNH